MCKKPREVEGKKTRSEEIEKGEFCSLVLYFSSREQFFVLFQLISTPTPNFSRNKNNQIKSRACIRDSLIGLMSPYKMPIFFVFLSPYKKTLFYVLLKSVIFVDFLKHLLANEEEKAFVKPNLPWDRCLEPA